MEVRHPHARTSDEVLKALQVDAARGLSAVEARKRLFNGKNKVRGPQPDSFLKRLIRQLSSPIAVVLVGAALATLAIAHYSDALIILLALLVNVAIGIFQEGKADGAFAALAKEEALRAVVLRDGERLEVAAETLVPGDIVLLATGAKIPADIRLIETHGLLVNEASLTGEWMPLEKKTDTVSKETVLAERVGMGYAGTLVVAGTARGVVTATGEDTELGKIAVALSTAPRTLTPLQKDIQAIARGILFLVGCVIVVIGALALLREMTIGETFLIGISIAVAAIPEGLPAAVTVVLAIGMERILKQGGLVRNLLAAETLGATSIILTDKTGTLTEGRMQAIGFATLSGTTEEAEGEQARLMLRAAVLASDGYIEERIEPTTGEKEIIARGRPIDQAILLSGLESGFSERAFQEETPRIDELAFSSDRRFGGMLVREGGQQVAYLKGAPELFLAQAKTALGIRGGARTLSLHDKAVFESALVRAAKEGKRVIAIGKVVTTADSFPEEHKLQAFLSELELLGFIIFSDVIRSDARASVAEMQSAGARVIMLTGDNPETALWFAEQVGIAHHGARAYTGSDIENVDDEALVELLSKHTVFARVSPTDKLRIARVLTAAGEVVAMTGDGVNDAPALQTASIGVALGSGTDVAKEAADLVLLTDSFSVVTFAIKEGRRLRDNIKKILAYLLSTNFSEIFIIMASLLAELPIPLLPTQIMWANLIEGGPLNVALAFEPLYPSAMKRSPKHPDIARVFSKELIRLILSVGILTGIMLVALHWYLVLQDTPEEVMRTIMFGAVSLSSFAGAISLKSFGTRIWHMDVRSNPWLLGSVVFSSALLLAALFVPFLQTIVHTVPLTLPELSLILLAGFINLILVEGAKEVYFIGPSRRQKLV